FVFVCDSKTGSMTLIEMAAMTQAQLQAADMTLKKKGSELQQYSQQKQAELGQEQAKKNEELYNNIREYIKKKFIQAAVSKVVIERLADKTKINVTGSIPMN
ncbi:MAG: hypothetical protein EBW42_16240, partial [Rhodobacterales bacterium]|nr:hypothetical protein [Rhodobacterales bacterium]